MRHRLVAPGCEWLVPFAETRIKVLLGLGLSYTDQTYDVNGYRVRVQVTPGHEYIKIDGGDSGQYQFFTTGDVAPPLGGVYLGYSLVSELKDGKIVSKPIASTMEEDTHIPPRWEYTSVLADMTVKFPIKGIWQMEGITEYPFHYLGKPYPFLMSTWGASDPIHTLGVFSGLAGQVKGQFDYNYDISPSRFVSKDNSPVQQGTADADWYRRACLQKVDHPTFGSRWFVVMVDISNVVHAYPVNAIGVIDWESLPPIYEGQGIKTGVSEDAIVRVAAPLPDWARKAGGPTPVKARDMTNYSANSFKLGMQYFPQYKWCFNSTGTKACCVVYEDLTPFNVAAGANPDHPDEYSLVESLAGLVEISLDIQLTGYEEKDFTFTTTLTTSERPSESGRFVLAAEYAWKTASTELDDLLVMESVISFDATEDMLTNPDGMIEDTEDSERLFTYGNSAIYYFNPVRDTLHPRLHHHLVHVRNDTAVTRVFSFVGRSFGKGDGTTGLLDLFPDPQEFTPSNVDEWFTHILAMDLRSLSFVLQQAYIKYPLPATGEGSAWDFTQSQRIRIVIKGVVAETVLLDQSSTLNDVLDTRHAGVDDRGLKMSIDKKSKPGLYTIARPGFPAKFRLSPVYDEITKYWIPEAAQYPWPFATGTISTSEVTPVVLQDYHLGACLYGVVSAGLFQMTAQSAVLNVHPKTGWSVVTDPVFYFRGSTGFPPFSNNTPWRYTHIPGAGVSTFDITADMVQGVVDIICMYSKGQEVRSSHLKEFNSAFGKNVINRRTIQFSMVSQTVTPAAPGSIYSSYWIYLQAQAYGSDKLLLFPIATYLQWTNVLGLNTTTYIFDGQYIDAQRIKRHAFEKFAPYPKDGRAYRSTEFLRTSVYSELPTLVRNGAQINPGEVLLSSTYRGPLLDGPIVGGSRLFF